MSLLLEPSHKQIKEEKLYQQMGLSDEEFALIESIIGEAAKLHRNGYLFCHVVRALQL